MSLNNYLTTRPAMSLCQRWWSRLHHTFQRCKPDLTFHQPPSFVTMTTITIPKTHVVMVTNRSPFSDTHGYMSSSSNGADRGTVLFRTCVHLQRRHNWRSLYEVMGCTSIDVVTLAREMLLMFGQAFLHGNSLEGLRYKELQYNRTTIRNIQDVLLFARDCKIDPNWQESVSLCTLLLSHSVSQPATWQAHIVHLQCLRPNFFARCTFNALFSHN